MTRHGRTLRKNPDEGMVAGVCAGLGQYFDLDVRLVRALFVAAAAVGGFGPGLYVALWIFLQDVDLVPDDVPQMRYSIDPLLDKKSQ